MNKFCEDIKKTGISFEQIGELTSVYTKTIIACKDRNVEVADYIAEDEIVAIAKKMKDGSNALSEMIRLVNSMKGVSDTDKRDIVIEISTK